MGRSTGNRLPVVTLLLAVLMIAGFAVSGMAPAGASLEAERAREAAQEFYHRHPDVTLSERDRSLLGARYVEEILAAQEFKAGRRSTTPPRRRARIQQQFDALATAAFRARQAADPAWRFGVNPGDRATRDFFAYGFFHDAVMGFVISLAFLLIAGIGIEGAWGSGAFALFCLVALFFPALAHAGLANPGGVPFSGASGLLAALLVAYWLRGWGGRLALPGWMLLPLWLFAEYIIVRGVWLDRVGDPPIFAHATGLAVGILAAAGVGMLGLERRLAERAGPSQSASNPALALAARAIAEGQLEAAWSALSNAAAENPEDDELVLAWWELACEEGRAGEVVDLILPRIAEELRRGDGETAIEYWFEIVHHAPEVEVEARITARLAEALIERGDSAGAREALRRAVEDTQGLTTALAQRVVRSARELDPKIAQAAAAIALKDPQLDPASREALEELLETGDPGAELTPSHEDEVTDSVDPAPPILDLNDRIQSDEEDPEESPGEFAMSASEEEDSTIGEEEPDPQEIEDATFSELGLAEDEELAPPDEADEASPGFGTIDLSEIDPAALSIASPEDEIELAAPEPVEGEMSEPGDGEDDSGDSFQDDSEDLEFLDPLELLSEDEFESVAVETEIVDPDALSASNLAEVAEEADAGGDVLAAGEIVLDEDEDETLAPSDEEDRIIELTEELLVVEDEPPAESVFRSAKVIEAVPVGIGEDVLEVEIDGRGVGRIPYPRIEALAVAAISGLSARPVLVMDLVLNWKADPGEPFKLIRIKGNLFDPLTLAPEAESPLHALKEIIAAIADRSGAECLPDSAAVAGNPFRRFQDLAEYEQAILGVSS